MESLPRSLELFPIVSSRGSMNRFFQPLTEAEQQWVRDQFERAREFARKFDPQALDDSPILEALDSAFVIYLETEGEPRGANEVVLAIRAAFGAQLVKDLGFRWVIVTDDYGTDLAVVARPGRGDVTIVPGDFVAKRYVRREAPFLVAAITEIRHHLDQIASEWGEPNGPLS